MKKLTNVPNLTELTDRSIKEQFRDGTFREGTRLTEEQLANRLGISQSPVREALIVWNTKAFRRNADS
jgi:DNA-binding GntR family transcriptional regulator